jgi:hypothetical protein
VKEANDRKFPSFIFILNDARRDKHLTTSLQSVTLDPLIH